MLSYMYCAYLVNIK